MPLRRPPHTLHRECGAYEHQERYPFWPIEHRASEPAGSNYKYQKLQSHAGRSLQLAEVHLKQQIERRRNGAILLLL